MNLPEGTMRGKGRLRLRGAFSAARFGAIPWWDERFLSRVLLSFLLVLFTIGSPGVSIAATRDSGECPGASACGSDEGAKGGCAHSRGCGGDCEKSRGCDGHRARCVCSAVREAFAPTDDDDSRTPLPFAGTIRPRPHGSIPSIDMRPPVPPPRAS
ncbi:MAG: hypothetical protein JW958_13015 [Candidatus Eisenbacteria bacterium]|nr:hypothetical protein [Candidatus Eisenbacteria bacterium]